MLNLADWSETLDLLVDLFFFSRLLGFGLHSRPFPVLFSKTLWYPYPTTVLSRSACQSSVKMSFLSSIQYCCWSSTHLSQNNVLFFATSG